MKNIPAQFTLVLNITHVTLSGNAIEVGFIPLSFSVIG